MSEGSAIPPMGLHPEPDGDEMCVALKSLALPDEGDNLQNPTIGDVVNFTVDGKITRIEGDKAYIEPTAVNGEPVSEAEETEGPSLDDQQAALSQQAAQLDQTGGAM